MAKRILIVDDIPRNIQVLGGILHNHGYEIGYASDGLKALERIKSVRFDLILLDIMMPGMDGYEVCRIIRNNEDMVDVPIIFITAKSDTESLVRGLQVGAVDYITKPFNEAELIARVETHLALKESREALRESQKQLNIANTAKDKLFSIIAHDLLNPISIIQISLESLIEFKDNFDKDSLVGKLDVTLENVRLITDLLSNLMNWSRSQSAAIQASPESVNLSGLLTPVLNLLNPHAVSKNISIKTFIPDGFGLHADPNLLVTVMRNLVGNALKFTPAGGDIVIRAYKNADEISIEVADTGVGIPHDRLNTIFEPGEFHSTRGTANEAGTGFGLILCREFVEKMGGRVRVDSIVGEGTVFQVILPA